MNDILGTGKRDKMYTNFGIIRDLTIITLLGISKDLVKTTN